MKAELVPVIRPAVRLQLCAMLAGGTSVEISVLRPELGLSPSAFSKQVAASVEAGYLSQNRGKRDSRKTWLSLTKAGSRAYRGRIAALEAIVSGRFSPGAAS